MAYLHVLYIFKIELNFFPAFTPLVSLYYLSVCQSLPLTPYPRPSPFSSPPPLSLSLSPSLSLFFSNFDHPLSNKGRVDNFLFLFAPPSFSLSLSLSISSLSICLFGKSTLQLDSKVYIYIIFFASLHIVRF